MLGIKVGLLCVQERPEDRPTMSDVVSMLSNESTDLAPPKQPAFSIRTSSSASPMKQTVSHNDVTFTDIEAR